MSERHLNYTKKKSDGTYTLVVVCAQCGKAIEELLTYTILAHDYNKKNAKYNRLCKECKENINLSLKIKYFAFCLDVCKKETEMRIHTDKDGTYLECLTCEQLYHVNKPKIESFDYNKQFSRGS